MDSELAKLEKEKVELTEIQEKAVVVRAEFKELEEEKRKLDVQQKQQNK